MKKTKKLTQKFKKNKKFTQKMKKPKTKKKGPSSDSSPGPLRPKRRITPLDLWPDFNENFDSMHVIKICLA